MAKQRISKKGFGVALKETPAIVLGGVGAKLAMKHIPIKDTRITPLIPVALGLFLMTQQGFMKGIGQGMVAVGATEAIHGFAPGIFGDDEIGAIDMETIEGYEGYGDANPMMGTGVIMGSDDAYASYGSY